MRLLHSSSRIGSPQQAFSIALTLLLLLPSLALAAPVTWDGSESTNFNLGDNWDTGGVPGLEDVATFTDAGSGLPNQPELSSALTILGINFSNTAANGYTLSSTGAALTLTQATAINSAANSGTNTISLDLILDGVDGGTQFINRTGSTNLILSGVISGDDAAAIVRFGSNSATGALTISGTSNSYVGNTWITGTGTTGSGAVAVASIGNAGANSSLGAGSIVHLGTGGTGGILRYTGAGETLGTGTGKVINLNGTTGGGTIDGSGTGALVIESGQLTFTGEGNKTLGLSGSNSTGNTILAGIVNNAGGITTVTKSGSGTWTLGGVNTYTGNTNINGGTLVVSSIGNTGSVTSNLGTAVLNIGNSDISGSLRYIGAGETSNRVINVAGSTGGATISNEGSGALVLNNVAVTGSGAKTLTLTGTNTGNNIISSDLGDVGGAMRILKSGDGTWILSGTNTHSTATSISGGLLGATSGAALGSGPLLFLQNGTGSFFASGADLIMANGVSIERPSSGSGGNTARFTGDYSITVNGNVISSPNTQSGGVTNRGISNEIAGLGKALTFNGTYQTTTSASATNSLTFSGAGRTIYNGALLDSTNGRPLNLSYTGTGSLTLAGANETTGTKSFSGAGTVFLNSAGAVGPSGTVTLGGSTIDSSANLPVNMTSSGGVNVTENLIYGGTQSLSFGTGDVTFWQAGGTATREITLNGTNKTLGFGGVSVTANDTNRTLRVNNGGGGSGNMLSLGGMNISNTNNNRRVTIEGDARVVITGAVANGGTSTASGLTYAGTGVLILNGENSYTGSTIITGGTVLVNGSLTTSTISVGSGATLGGNGNTGAGPVTFQSGSTLAAGASPGGFNLGATVLEGGANLNWQIYDAEGAAGVGYDLTTITGELDISDLTEEMQYNINLWSLSGIGPDANGAPINLGMNHTWTLFASNTTIAGFDASLFNINEGATNGTAGWQGTPGTFTVSLADNDTDIVLNYTAIPEPDVRTLAALVLAGVVLIKRRARRS